MELTPGEWQYEPGDCGDPAKGIPEQPAVIFAEAPMIAGEDARVLIATVHGATYKQPSVVLDESEWPEDSYGSPDSNASVLVAAKDLFAVLAGHENGTTPVLAGLCFIAADAIDGSRELTSRKKRQVVEALRERGTKAYQAFAKASGLSSRKLPLIIDPDEPAFEEPPEGKPTPRPWKRGHDRSLIVALASPRNESEVNYGGPLICEVTNEADAALIHRAVKFYDEAGGEFGGIKAANAKAVTYGSALRDLFFAMRNDLAARGRPLSWKSDSAMGRAEALVMAAHPSLI